MRWLRSHGSPRRALLVMPAPFSFVMGPRLGEDGFQNPFASVFVSQSPVWIVVFYVSVSTIPTPRPLKSMSRNVLVSTSSLHTLCA